VDLPFKNDLYISMLDKFGSVFLKKGCFICGEERLQLHINIGNTLFHIVSEKYFKDC
jgi:hypothetical protein